jgi:hypothetical protein
MIRQVWQSLTYKPHAAYLRPMGFLYEALALQQHALAKNKPWAAHYALCQRVIAEYVEAHPEIEHWVILGVGTGEDVPWAVLLESVERLTLVDVVILPETKKHWQRRYPKPSAQVDWLEMDVSGVLDSVYRKPQSTAQRTLEMGDWPEDWSGAGVISLNMLMQLAVLPGLWLKRQGVPAEQIQSFSRQLIAAHRALLGRLAKTTPVLLITEVGEKWRTPEGEVLFHEDWLEETAFSLHAWEWAYRYLPRRQIEIIRMMVALDLSAH